jgi:dephospho-CoA kinase
MITVGLTGGIGAGKSLVSEMLATKGAAVVNADLAGHRSYRKGMPAYERLIAEFGGDILDGEGEIDRGKLGQRVFADRQQRERLNDIVWPAMAELMEQDLRALRASGQPVAVLEAAVLIEAGWGYLADEIWVVIASPQVAHQRLVETKEMPPEQAQARIRAQLTNEERKWYADAVIENNGSVEELQRRVNEVWADLQRRLAGGATSACGG